jgi:hypothetical protein
VVGRSEPDECCGDMDKIVKRLEDLIEDRKSFISGDPEFDEIFIKDIDALRLSIGIIMLVKTLRPQM